ncbi:DUF6090 family protein [Algoriphagus sp.]|uniref:DUF6090 family protein n=1 Tax=Algoriphagus sp. TaxID=1872435 RepID=UPI0025D2779D|nr:DUF6090 family protein [Algoriphagus sp.]
MIKFYRIIRQRLLSENKITKYMIYAIGEIVLVVIGILIALQLNTWNQDRIDRKMEKKILTDLRQELKTNKQKIRAAIERREDRYNPLDRYMKLMEEDSIPFLDFLEIHKVNFFSGQISPSFGVINSLISSGEVNLISNDSLKYLATDWKDVIAVFMSVEKSSFDGHRRFSDYFDTRFPFLGNQFHNKSPEDLQDRFEKIIDDVEYRNKLITVKQHFEGAIRIGEETIEYIDGMTNLIDREIEKMN